MLYHYSWHCFNSFFSYSFFKWSPVHSNSHGIRISKWSDNIDEIEIQFYIHRGLFKRFIDTWTLLGKITAFSPYFATFDDDEIIFTKNDYCLINDSHRLTVKQLLSFDSTKFEQLIRSELPNNKIIRTRLEDPTRLRDQISIPTNFIKYYLILFISSSLARYRPVLWSAILAGETEEQSKFALEYRNAVSQYADDYRGFDLISKGANIFSSIYNKDFGLIPFRA